MKSALFVFVVIGLAFADVSHIVDDSTTTTTYPPRPYQFSYEAGRYPGHVDRTHAEVGDGAGTVRGAFSYVDPRNQVRTVEYTADENGFYPQLSHQPQNTKAVDLATNRHLELYNKIAERNSDPNYVQGGGVPKDSEAVAYAKQKHLSLFEKIAAEHARLGEEQLAQRLAFEATSIRNDEESNYNQ
ncbi:CLUMA_CG013435, isoform A [Clunio marinus]|uniref:CLUMA_CG013435, isoform A n=1 Tax=Clunio marinus TaxID=568069 RepID=A0A1J1IIT9_9DIPT|nr:CLUMA_CG013435, isoform A [Clunio marinus]